MLVIVGMVSLQNPTNVSYYCHFSVPNMETDDEQRGADGPVPGAYSVKQQLALDLVNKAVRRFSRGRMRLLPRRQGPYLCHVRLGAHD